MLPAINLVVLVASLGLLGYLIYEQHERPNSDKPDKGAAKPATSGEDEIRPEVAKLRGEVKKLDRTIQERSSPPDYAPQIKAIDDRLVDLGKTLANLNDRVDAVSKRVDGLGKGEGLDSSPRFEAIEKRVAEMSGALDAIKSQVAAPTGTSATPSNGLVRAIALFNTGKWAEARDAFTKLQAASPDDARVWYFSALANGLATKDWKGESERLVTEGMAREKAGKPEKAKIDAAFSDLTTATGKDWLAFYRNRAAQEATNR